MYGLYGLLISKKKKKFLLDHNVRDKSALIPFLDWFIVTMFFTRSDWFPVQIDNSQSDLVDKSCFDACSYCHVWKNYYNSCAVVIKPGVLLRVVCISSFGWSVYGNLTIILKIRY